MRLNLQQETCSWGCEAEFTCLVRLSVVHHVFKQCSFAICKSIHRKLSMRLTFSYPVLNTESTMLGPGEMFQIKVLRGLEITILRSVLQVQ